MPLQHNAGRCQAQQLQLRVMGRQSLAHAPTGFPVRLKRPRATRQLQAPLYNSNNSDQSCSSCAKTHTHECVRNVFALCPCSWHNYKTVNSATSTRNSDTNNRIWLLRSPLLCCHLCLSVLQPSPKCELHGRLEQHLCLSWPLIPMNSTITIFF